MVYPKSNWLTTRKEKRWLMIFDNAGMRPPEYFVISNSDPFIDKESETILRGYWPIGAVGSILITSRQYYNFMKDVNRKGETVKPFNEHESWDLLVLLLGDIWNDAEKSGQLTPADMQAAKSWVKKLEGLRKYPWQAFTHSMNFSRYI
jgi:hypothetical protein